MFRLAAYLKEYKKECILGPIFKFLEVIFELLLPTIMALIINRGISQGDFGYVLSMGGLMVLMAFCGYGSALICQRFAAQASQGFGTVLRNTVFQRILSFSYTQIEQFGAPTLTNRVTNDINQLQQWVAMMIRLVSRAPFICLGSILMSFFLDVKLALILLAATPVLALIIFYLTKNSAPLYRSYQKKLDRLGAILRENLAGVRVIRAFSKTEEETARFGKANNDLMNNGFAIGWLSSFFNPLTSLVVNLMILLILWTGGLHIDSGRLSQGQIIALINYVNQILIALLVLSNLVILLTKSMASAARINEILDTPPGLSPAFPEALPEANAPVLEFRDVSFGYHQTGDHALEHISMAIHQGETIGIIGGTGSGKSTFVNLIPRFYDVTSGSILVNGIPVTQYPLPELRRKIGIVHQQALLFSGTIAENIRWGNADAGMDEVRAAAVTAQSEEFISNLPLGYDSPVRRGGSNLSGGQRQRLTIARALVSNPEILILDDASSALDFLTDARLRQAIRANSRVQTVLLVSQRVGVVRSADRILVFEDGKLAGTGTHEALFESCETYREICLSQLSGEEAQQ
ncbi:Xenobiotic-transporting ATPase [Syntrophobotulus glycolicus DSM 8271]|uniref:Xenobiotic-transporting ATPase n=1 Tax=Syntrophobotulus glycolicus (strain DSM 8271 / FlGlyR) TaxID=645991 RepID=F0SXK2_SYNGF|nr:ABC transporter ATP-binding protein [Syntrophobotulus glycolicus]ADY55835.1 Xenobiotic-transporting ATPase [Syntrophobotulus glycolicus DSM 8271]